MCIQIGKVGATIYFCTFLVIASNIIMALFMAVSAEYVSYDLVVSDTALVSVNHLQRFQVRRLSELILHVSSAIATQVLLFTRREWLKLDLVATGFIRLKLIQGVWH